LLWGLFGNVLVGERGGFVKIFKWVLVTFYYLFCWLALLGLGSGIGGFLVFGFFFHLS
jgi:hypothetical protein